MEKVYVDGGPAIDGISLNDIFKVYQGDFRLLLKECLEAGKEFAFGIHGKSGTNEFKRGPMSGGTTNNVNLNDVMKTKPTGYDKVLVVYHVHPSTSPPGMRPSGVSSLPGKEMDVQIAQTTDYRGLFFLVGTLVDPKPKDTVVEATKKSARSLYTWPEKIETTGPRRTTNPAPKISHYGQVWLVYNEAAPQTAFPT